MNPKEKNLKQRNERLGEIRKNKDSLGGYKMKIIEYNNALDIVVEFQDEYGARINTQYDNFKRGIIKNPYHPNVYNIGYIGEGKYKSRKKSGEHTEVYSMWCNMLERCYDPYYLNKKPTYIDCYVCDEWLNFQNFAEWFYKNYYKIPGERMHLDKDILIKGNKIYSPDTCIIVSNRINVLFTKSDKARGECPIGVNYHKRDNVYEVYCSILDDNGNKKKKYLGRFDNELDAFYSYKKFKENYIKQVADEYYSKGLIPKKLYDALYRYEVEIND